MEDDQSGRGGGSSGAKSREASAVMDGNAEPTQSHSKCQDTAWGAGKDPSRTVQAVPWPWHSRAFMTMIQPPGPVAFSGVSLSARAQQGNAACELAQQPPEARTRAGLSSLLEQQQHFWQSAAWRQPQARS